MLLEKTNPVGQACWCALWSLFAAWPVFAKRHFGGAGGIGEKSLAEHGAINASQYGALQYNLQIATAGRLLAVYALKLEPLGDPTHLSVLVDSFNVSFCWYLCLLL